MSSTEAFDIAGTCLYQVSRPEVKEGFALTAIIFILKRFFQLYLCDVANLGPYAMRALMFVFFLLRISSGCLGQSEQPGVVTVEQLKCEYSQTPLAIDEVYPRFTWKLGGGGCQQSYSFLFSKDSAALHNGTAWKIGPIASSRYYYQYDGPPLEPLTKYYWGVEIITCDGQLLPLAASHFETGMRGKQSWKGAWISDGFDKEYLPASRFQKTFQVTKKVSSVRCYIASAGLHMLVMNDIPDKTEFLNPIFTDFSKRIMYNTYDITNAVRTGENVVQVTLGNGWYNHQPQTSWNFSAAPWRERPGFILNIVIHYADGDTHTIATDPTWTFSSSPFLFNGVYAGERYDQRYAPADSISNPAQPVVVVQAPEVQIHAQNLPPIVRESIGRPVSVSRTSPVSYLIEFSKNISGVAAVRIPAMPDRSRLEFIYGERVSSGKVYNRLLDTHYFSSRTHGEFQTDVVINTTGNFTFSPQFSYKGFKFLEIKSNSPVKFSPNDLEAFFVHSDVEPIGQFESSSVMLNSIWAISNNSFLGNLVGYPTDCPHREKNGWTGDGHLTAELGLFNFDMIKTYEKWMVDHRDAQRAAGELPLIIPTAGWGYHLDAFDWTCSAVMIPWSVYLFTGDRRIVERNYEMMKRFMEYWEGRASKYLLGSGIGDWQSLNNSASKALISSAYYYEANRIMARMALISNDLEAASEYSENAEKIKTAVSEKYYSPENGFYAGGLQTEQALLLEFDMVPDDKKEQVIAQLLKSIRDSGGLIDAGVIGAKAVPRALSMHGHDQIAYQLVTRVEKPSWGYTVSKGETTLPESLWEEGGSKNHAYFGTVSAWLYRVLGGINPVEDYPGFEKIAFATYIPPDLDFVKVAHESPQGQVLSEWRKSGTKVSHRIKVPGNSTASYKLPAGYFYHGIKNESRPGNYRPRFDEATNTLALAAGEYTIDLGDSSEWESRQNILFNGQNIAVLRLGEGVESRQVKIGLSLETDHLPGSTVVYELVNAYPADDFFSIEGDTLLNLRPIDDPDELYQAIVKAYYYDKETGARAVTESYIGIEAGKIQQSVGFLLYPNPAGEVLTIKSDSPLPNAVKVWVYSSSGTLLKEELARSHQSEFSVGIGALPEGLYIIRFDIGGTVHQLKFLKQT